MLPSPPCSARTAKRLAVVIVHYHLRPGGVTRVIERAVESLKGMVDVLILSGEAPASNSPLAANCETLEALAYNAIPTNTINHQFEHIRGIVHERLGRDPDLWHIHNHALGKNSFLPRLVWYLAHQGERLLLQPHDFAEDGRPENYRMLREHLGEAMELILYPDAPHVWYAPINYRDKGFLQESGLSHVFELPNAVCSMPPSSVAPKAAGAAKTVVYPARAIRRKNIGEILLWSLLAPKDVRFLITMAPKNPTWKTIYSNWVTFAEELKLPIEFDAGSQRDFPTLIHEADLLITTSIAEGFGLAFLEPWLEGKPLFGRNLPEITSDFTACHIDLSGLYITLPIPIDWIGEDNFIAALETALRKTIDAYQKPWDDSLLELAKKALIVDGRIDFGRLDEPMQQRVIRHLIKHPLDRQKLPPFPDQIPDGLVTHNQGQVKKRYDLQAYGNRLSSLYLDLAQTPTGPIGAIKARTLLECFLQPARFNLLRT